VSWIAVASIVTAFGLGYNLSSSVFLRTTQPYKIETKDGGKFDGTIIRAGDRGVLFVTADGKQVTLLPWAEIKQITRTPLQ
jgi:hypothetical protein